MSKTRKRYQAAGEWLEIGPGLWVSNEAFSVAGMKIGHRMSVVALEGGGAAVLSPVAWSESWRKPLESLGGVAALVAPSLMHDTHVDGWLEAWPDARFFAPAGMARMHPDWRKPERLDGDDAKEFLGPELEMRRIRGIPKINEIAVHHRPTASLILCDLMFNLGTELPGLTRVLTRLTGTCGGPSRSRLFAAFIKDRAAFAESLHGLLDLPFDRVIPGHGEIVDTGGKAVLRAVYADYLES